jgi:hypothetical protein
MDTHRDGKGAKVASVVPGFTLSDWVALYDEQRALHFRLDEGWLVVHCFAMTDAGVLDLRAFLVEPCSLDSEPAVLDRVQAIGEQWELAPGPVLTSRRLRVAAAQGSALPEARRQLAIMAAMLDASDDRDDTASRDLARLVVRYSELLGQPGARERLADEEGVGVNGIKARLRLARQQGLWITSGPGRPGTPSATAYELAQEEPS